MRRPGGVSKSEMLAAMAALGQTNSGSEIAEVLDSHPVLCTPVALALLRQDALAGTVLGRPVEGSRADDIRASWRTRFDVVGVLLHQRHHRWLISQATNGDEEPRAAAELHAPTTLLVIVSALAGSVPALKGPTLDPTADADLIAATLEQVTGRTVQLPTYAAERGTSWSVLIVGCARCRTTYPLVRATHVDLLEAPELEEVVRECRINDGCCPACQTRLCVPLREWISDDGPAFYPLEAATCAWRLAASSVAYQPAPGVPRVQDADRILEVAFAALLTRRPFPPTADDVLTTKHVIAYSPSEVAAAAAQAQEAQDDPVHRQIESWCMEIARKLDEGFLALFEVEQSCVRLADAMSLVAPLPGLVGVASAHQRLAHALLEEAAARNAGAEPRTRARAAAAAALAYLAVGEHSLADAMTLRAETALAEDPGADLDLELTVQDVKRDVLRRQGRWVELEKLPEAPGRRINEARIDERVVTLIKDGQRLSDMARTVNPAAPLKEYPGHLRRVRTLVETLESEPGAERGVPLMRIALSASLANYGGNLAEALEFTRRHAPGSVREENTVDVLRQVRAMLREALDIALDLGHREFAGIQSGTLAHVCELLGESQEAEDQWADAFEHARACGNHGVAYESSVRLCERALQRGDVAVAFERFDGAALECVRELVGFGFAEHPGDFAALPELAGGLLDAGADPAHVAATLESARAARTANAIDKRMPRGESMTDSVYAQWVDATGSVVATADDLRANLRTLGAGSVWLTLVRNGETLRSIAVWDGGATAGPAQRVAVPEGWRPDACAKLATAILEPHERLFSMNADDVLVFSLPQEISGLPTGALPFDGRPLCAHVPTICVHGVSIFEAAGDQPTPFCSALVVGAPERPDAVDLPGARHEAHEVERLARDAGLSTTRLTGGQASAVAVLAAAPSHDIIHISCHADDGVLLLAGAPGDYGQLDERRIADELVLAPGALVNLSGCRTGHAADARGPLLDGLVPRMLLAGARATVASLWPIGDMVTVDFQSAFYRHLLAGSVPARALALAQTDAWAGRLGPRLVDPSVWGAFVVYGAG